MPVLTSLLTGTHSRKPFIPYNTVDPPPPRASAGTRSVTPSWVRREVVTVAIPFRAVVLIFHKR